MSRWESIRKELPHYILLLVLAYVALQIVRNIMPTIVLWQELVLVLALAIGYVIAVTKLGYAPESWFPDR